MNAKLPNGFTSRNATLEDIPAVVDLNNDYDEHYLGYRGSTINLIETDWKNPKFEPENDIHLVFNPSGELVGYIEVWSTSDPPVHPWLWGRVHPRYVRRGIGTYLMNWGEERAQHGIPRCPADARISYRVGTVSTIEPSKQFLEKLGLQLVRHSFRMFIQMDEAPPEPILNAGITIRPVTDPHTDIETLCRIDNEAFRDHYGYIEQPFEDELAMFKNWLTNDESSNDPSLWYLAMDGDNAVGYALGARWDHENRDYGHISGLGVLRPYRRRGIGLALLHHAFGEYYQRGKQGVALGVDAENLTGALMLYEKAGMQVHRRFDLYEKELRPGMEISVESL
jgi:ribosomal protein S18 acetylase RimI-like enzyme